MKTNHSPINGARHSSAITATAIGSLPDSPFELNRVSLAQLHRFARNRLQRLRERLGRHAFPEGEADDLVAEVLLAALRCQARGDAQIMTLASPEVYLNYLLVQIEHRTQQLGRRPDSRQAHVPLDQVGHEVDLVLQTDPAVESA